MPSTASLLRLFLLSVVAAVVLYVITAVASDLDAVGSAMLQLGSVGWLMVLGLSLVNYGLRFVRWQGYLLQLEHRVPPVLSAGYYLAGFAFTATPGKAGEAVRSLYLRRRGVGYVQSLAALFAERLMDLVAMVLLALAAAWTFPQARMPVILLTVVILVLLHAVHSTGLHDLLSRWLARLPWGRFRRLGVHGLDLLRNASTLLSSRPLYAGLALGLVAWGAEGVGFWLILEYLDLPVSLALAVGVYAAAVLVGALSFIPGGLGSTEAVMVLLLVLLGADTPTAVAATLICRLATLWFAVLIGLVAVVSLELRGDRLAGVATAPVESKQL